MAATPLPYKWSVRYGSGGDVMKTHKATNVLGQAALPALLLLKESPSQLIEAR
jgi:hypothetical protein